jgi:signal transduction histidine kinase
MSALRGSPRTREVLAWGVFAATCLAVAAGAWLGSGSGEALDAVLAVSFTATGALITIHRPGNALGPVGLFMGLAGVAYLADGYASWAPDPGAAAAAAAGWLASWLWAPPVLALGSVVLQLVPDGRPAGPRLRPLLIGTWGFIAVFTVVAALGLPDSLPTVVGAAIAVVGAALLVASVASLVVRYRSARGYERRQLTWIVAGGVVTVAAVLGDALLPAPAGTVVEAGAGVVLPLALGVAVLRHDLYAMDPVLRRWLTYLLLAGALAAVTLLVSTVVVSLVGRDRPTYALVLTVVAAVLAAGPLERLARRAIGRMLYGGRGDPYLVVAGLARAIAEASGPEDTMTAVADAARRAVGAPFAKLAVGGTGRAVSVGTPADTTLSLPVTFHGEEQGVLSLAPRSPAEPFDDLDRRVLGDVAHQAGPAVAAALRTLDLERTREELVVAREEERRRLREDLHDGVGPVLAGLAFTVDAATTHVEPHQTRLAAQLDSVREQARRAIGNVRRVTRGLRPESLDELGLVGALHEIADRHPSADIRLELDGQLPWPALGAATEVAVLHVVAEAVSNAVRHARAESVRVELCAADGLFTARVTDDGPGLPDAPTVGIGLESMRRRTEELGGRFTIGRAGDAGTQVQMEVPL